jgi:hypothetical protein
MRNLPSITDSGVSCFNIRLICTTTTTGIDANGIGSNGVDENGTEVKVKGDTDAKGIVNEKQGD